MRIFLRPGALLLCLLLCFPALCLAGQQSPCTVDFDLLTSLNGDCVGWLYQPQSGLNQPVMRHETDDWYYERAFDGVKVYQMGSVYLHAQDSLSDPVIVLHGQAREEGCLSALPAMREQQAFDRQSQFWLLTPAGHFQASAFACLDISEKELESCLPAEEPFAQWLEQVLAQSLVRPDPQSLPRQGDRLLMLAARHLNGTVTLVMARLSAAMEAAPDAPNLSKLALDSAETFNGMVNAGPAGRLMLYAQNDPLYANMRYESAIRNGDHRDFGGGGCGPTAMAIIVANLVEPENLPLLGQYAQSGLGYLFCPCSVNRVYCNHTHVPYQLATPAEYLRYLPVAMGDFAAGNNQWGFVARRVNTQGTNIHFADYVCEAYGLRSTPVNGLESALELMKTKTGEGMILTCALRGSPYTNNSHFVVITGVDDTYFYVLDPLRRTAQDYAKTDKREILEVLEPGVTRIRLTDFARSDLSPVSYITRGDAQP